MYYLGIDIGTTHLKTCLLDENLQVAHMTVDDNHLDARARIGEGYDPRMLWQSIEETLHIALYDIDASQVQAIAVTSMADAGLPVDAAGLPLGPIIPWQKTNGDRYKQELLDSIDPYELYRRTGLIYHPKYPAMHLLALKHESAETFSQMKAWLSVSDWVIHQLCSRMVMDESQACRTMLYDISKHQWDGQLIDATGLTGKLPPVVSMGTSVGTLRPDLAARFRLNPAVQIITGGHDHLCAAIAVGADQSGQIVNSMGTAEVYVGMIDQPIRCREAFDLCLNQGCTSGGRYYWMANLPASGASIEWMRRILSTEGEVKYNLFLQEEFLSEPSPVLYFPYLNGSGTPHTNADQRAVFLGLSSDTTVYQLIKAIYEGIGYESRWILDALTSLGLAGSSILAVGGGTKNKTLMQTKANVMQKPIRATELDEATGIGAAILAARACGLEVGLTRPLPSSQAPSETPSGWFTPDPALASHYLTGYSHYQQIHQALLSVRKGWLP
jgi:xylulokinase